MQYTQQTQRLARRVAPSIHKHRCRDRRPTRDKHATSHTPSVYTVLSKNTPLTLVIVVFRQCFGVEFKMYWLSFSHCAVLTACAHHSAPQHRNPTRKDSGLTKAVVKLKSKNKHFPRDVPEPVTSRWPAAGWT